MKQTLRTNIQRYAGLGFVMLMGLIILWTFSPRPTAVLTASTVHMNSSLLLDIARINNHLIAVGEKGRIFISQDTGKTWSWVPTPTKATLTGIFFENEKEAIVIGHDAVILQTHDSGQSWTLQHSDWRQESPLLGVNAIDRLHITAVGAYGLLMESSDGGQHWNTRRIIKDDKHFNALTQLDNGVMLIVGEAGTVLRSDDLAKHWATIPSPYDGSFFGALALGGGQALLFGMRGHMYRFDSTDNHFEMVGDIKTNPVSGTFIPTFLTRTTLLGALRWDEKYVAVTGQDGTLLISTDNGHHFTPYVIPGHHMNTALVHIQTKPNTSRLLVLGEQGMGFLDIPKPLP